MLRRVGTGEHMVITVRGRPVARLVPLQRSRRDDLARLARDTTDGLGPVR
jgi:prevent-host-death family protein